MTDAVPGASIIEPLGGHGGGEHYDFGLSQGLADAGVDTVLYSCEKTIAPDAAGFRVEPTYWGIYGEAPSWIRGLRYIRGLFQTLASTRRRRARIWHMHVYNVGLLEWFTLFLGRVAGLKVVLTFHDVLSFIPRRFDRAAVKAAHGLAHRVIVHNQASLEELQKALGGLSRKTRIVPHGSYLHTLPDPMPTRETSRAELGIALDRKVLLFFGHIKKVKRLDLMLDAMPEVVKADPSVLLLIAGRAWGVELDEYKRQIEWLGLQGHCQLDTQYIPNEQLPYYFMSADLAVLPYQRIYQSGVLIRALSYGRPVLASDLPATRECIRDGENGFLFPAGDVHALAGKLTKCLSDEIDLEQVAAKGHAYVRDALNWDDIGQATLQVYREACGSARLKSE